MVVLVNTVMGQAQSSSTTEYNNTLPNFFPLNKENFTRLSSSYGPRVHPLNSKIKKHNGLDLVAKKGSAVYASAEGKVIESGFDKGYGNYVTLQHGKHIKTLYAHLLLAIVKKGQNVAQGQIIGAVGESGMVTGPHLHYEIWNKGKQLNPLLLWSKTQIKTTTGKTPVK